MKFFIAIALIATVASAAIVKPTAVNGELAEIQEIVAAIHSPSTDPATAAALEQMLIDVLGLNPEPVVVGPAIIEANPIVIGPAVIEQEPISVGPAVIEHEPISVGPAIIDSLPEAVVAPTPVAESASPALVQIILNINQAAVESAPAAPGPAVTPEVVKPDPVIVVDSAPEPVQVVETAPVPAEPVQVVEVAPVPAEPVVIGTPVLPAPAVTLPEELN